MHFSRILAILAAGAFVSAAPMREGEEHEQATKHIITPGMDRSAHGEKGMIADGMMRTSKADGTMIPNNNMGSAGMSAIGIHERADATHDMEWDREKMRDFDHANYADQHADHGDHAFDREK